MDFIKPYIQIIEERLSQAGFACEFVKRSQEEIQEIIDLAAEEKYSFYNTKLVLL